MAVRRPSIARRIESIRRAQARHEAHNARFDKHVANFDKMDARFERQMDEIRELLKRVQRETAKFGRTRVSVRIAEIGVSQKKTERSLRAFLNSRKNCR